MRDNQLNNIPQFLNQEFFLLLNWLPFQESTVCPSILPEDRQMLFFLHLLFLTLLTVTCANIISFSLNIYTYISTKSHTHIYIYIRMYEPNLRTHAHTHTHTYIYTYVCINQIKRTHTHTHTYIYMDTHIYSDISHLNHENTLTNIDIISIESQEHTLIYTQNEKRTHMHTH